MAPRPLLSWRTFCDPRRGLSRGCVPSLRVPVLSLPGDVFLICPVIKLSLACFFTLTPTFWCVVSSRRCYPGVFSSSGPLPFFLSYLTSLLSSSRCWRASVFHPLPQTPCISVLLAVARFLLLTPSPSPLSCSLALRCLPFWFILPPTPSHGFSSLPRSHLCTCRNSSYLNQ